MKFHKNRKHFVDETFFEKIDTPSKAYILGLIVSDGYIDKKWNKLNFTSKDYELVNIIKKELCSEHKLSKYDIFDKRTNKSYIRYSIQISSKKIVNDLNKLGIYGNKSFTSDLPQINNNNIWHFIRGVFDGDGTIHQLNKLKNGRLRFGIVGSYNLLIKINDVFKNYDISSVKIRNTQHTDGKNKLIKLDCSNYNNLNKIKILMYDNSENLKLLRKYKIFNTLKEYKLGTYDRTHLLRKINMFDLNEKHIKTFDNIHLACDAIKSTYNQIHRVATGKRKQTKGYIFKYE